MMERRKDRIDWADAIGCVIVSVLLVVLAWLFLELTPPQNSAECDYWAAKLEAAK